MNPSNRTIEEKLAIVQQLRNNSNITANNKINDKYYKINNVIQVNQNSPNQAKPEENSHFLAFLIIRLVICVLIFGVIAFIGSKNPNVIRYVNAMITTEENGNLIDFMSPFTYTLQENVESSSEEAAGTQEGSNADADVPSTE